MLLQQRNSLQSSQRSSPRGPSLLEQQRMTAEIVSSCGKDSRPCRAGKHHFVLQGLCPVALRWEVRECVFTCLCVIFLCFGQVRCPLGSGTRRSEGTHLTQACRSPGRVKAVLGFQLLLLPCKRHVPLTLRKHHLLAICLSLWFVTFVPCGFHCWLSWATCFFGAETLCEGAPRPRHLPGGH